jgi:hypothetical protein
MTVSGGNDSTTGLMTVASRVWYEAKVACGRPGCPVVINVDSPDECELMADLAEAIKRHGETTHNDGSGGSAENSSITAHNDGTSDAAP